MDELPAHIGPYEVRDRLGHGGMGVVYLGFDPMLDRPVAIKVLKVPDDETRRRFLREARLAAKVHHPNIVSIYAVGEHEGNPYLAMEFIAGRTMAQIIRNGDTVPLARKVHWLSELCAGLAHAHTSGIVHRDVKPSNLLIAHGTGTLRLVDFGIAHGNEASGMTMAGMVVGTPQYMSPEQITGQPVDARSDIFSVGSVAYELLTGRQAFGGDNLYHVSRQIVGEEPRQIESFVPDAPQALVRTIMKCLQKEPDARPESARLIEREFLGIARRLDPDHTLVVIPAEPTVVGPGSDSTTSRRQMLKEAEEAIDHGQITTASDLIQRLESVGTSPNADVQQLRQRLHGRRLELRIQDAVMRAEQASQSGSLDEAESAIAALADIAPRHPALAALRHAHQQRLDERQVATLTSRARTALQHEKLDEAAALIAEALALDPDSGEALAVQQKLSDRTRAQRIARLVAQASRALEKEDPLAARRAIDALAKLDASHRDVERLQGRLAALTADAADHAGRNPTSATRPPSAPAPREPAAAPAAPPAAPSPAGARTGSSADQAAPALDHVLFRQSDSRVDVDGSLSSSGVESADGVGETTSRSPLVPVMVVLALLLAGGGAWFAFMRGSATPTEPATQSSTDAPANGKTPGTVTPPPGTAGSTASDTPTSTAGGDAKEEAEVVVPPPGTKTDVWAAARQHVSAGRFDRAMAAIDDVKGEPARAVHQERTRVVDAARRTALAARRVADDLRRTAVPEYILGMTRHAQADRDTAAGRLTQAVSEYMEARTHFLQAMQPAERAQAQQAGVTSPTQPPATSTPPGTTPGTPGTQPPATQPPPTQNTSSRVDLSTWSNEEARATISQFCGAYLARDLGLLNRLWPNMSPAWRTEFKEAFSTEGELVCLFESVNIVRTTDEFNAVTRLLTQLPGAAQRRRNLTLTLVPARDRLVIGNISVR